MDLLESLGLGTKQPEDNIVYFAIHADDIREGCAAADLAGLKARCMQLLLPHLEGYIWQRDRFDLHLSTDEAPSWCSTRSSNAKGSSSATSTATSEPPCLWGSLRFGDNIEDEWFVTWLVAFITRSISSTSARVWDNDGEFLLIEAAYSLPKWLKPETAGGRVFFRGGDLHVIPLPSRRRPTLPAFPSLHQALQILQADSVDTASPKVDAAIKGRLAGYPQAARQNMQVATCQVPRKVAQLLQAEPQLVAAAVESFYYRTPQDTKAAARMQHFPPAELLHVSVRFNRCMYAQLMGQQMAPPKGWPAMPLPSAPAFKSADLGLKITTGFEVVYGTAKAAAARGRAQAGGAASSKQAESAAGAGAAAGDGASAQAAALTEADVEGSPAWQAYVASLERSGFFQGQMPGSALHRQLMASALAAFSQTAAYSRANQQLSAPAERIDQILAQAQQGGISPAAEAEAGTDAAAGGLGLPGRLLPEDDDSWLTSWGDSLEEELARREQEQVQHAERKQRRSQGGRAAGQQADPAAEEKVVEVDAADVAAKLRSFVGHLSSYEGAELPQEGSTGSSSKGRAAGHHPKAGRDDFGLDMGNFFAELQKALGLEGGPGAAQQRRQHDDDPLYADLEGLSDDDDDDISSSEDEGSSFYSDEDEDASESGSDDDRQQRTARQQGGWTQHHHQQQQAAAAGAATAGPADKLLAAAADEVQVDQPARPSSSQLEAAWEVMTATDSDDDADAADDADFMEAYDLALQAQLAGTKMGESFERPPAAAGAAGAGQQQQGGADMDVELLPVDVDLNLVKGLVASYASQQGLPGPAGNLAGLLGLQLPAQAEAPGKRA